jgi:hypothetical protein
MSNWAGAPLSLVGVARRGKMGHRFSALLGVSLLTTIVSPCFGQNYEVVPLLLSAGTQILARALYADHGASKLFVCDTEFDIASQTQRKINCVKFNGYSSTQNSSIKISPQLPSKVNDISFWEVDQTSGALQFCRLFYGTGSSQCVSTKP